MKILIIEDDQLVANIYRNKFVLEGFEAETAADGGEGLELARRFQPDVILLDLILPNIPGLDVLRQIRVDKGLANLPVIVFSNTYMSSMVEEAWKAGATKCLFKTKCTPKQVIEAVRTVLKINSGAAAPAPKIEEIPNLPEGDADIDFQDQLRRDFVAQLPGVLNAMRADLQTLVKAPNDNVRVKQIEELYHRSHSLSSNAGIAGAMQIAMMADALEALLKELQEKPKNINVSTLRTVASAVDFMGILFERALSPEEPFPPTEVLVVDDDAISRRAITFAVEKANLKTLSVGDPIKALDLISQKKFDLVFLDVDMPSMNGFELCSRLRTLPAYAKTPVVFVTGLNDLENRANSTMSGGNDFIAKPFLFIELTVKALVHIFRSRFEPAKK